MPIPQKQLLLILEMSGVVFAKINQFSKAVTDVQGLSED